MAVSDASRAWPAGVLSRRRWLSLALAGGGLTLAGGGALTWLRGSVAAVPGLRALDARRYWTLSAIARAHLPPGEVFGPGADGEHDLARDIDAYLADEPEWIRSEIRRALTLVELGPALFDGRAATFPNLSPAEAAAHWRSWGESRLLVRRQVALGFRKLLSFVFYDQPRVWPHIGYPGPSLARASR
jgi:hypothetical protein